MSVKESGNFYGLVKRIIYMNCFVGMGAYRIPNITDTAYFFMKFYTFIFMMANFSVTYIGLTELTAISKREDLSYMARTMYQVLDYTNSSVAAVISPFLVWLQRKKVSGLEEIISAPVNRKKYFDDYLCACVNTDKDTCHGLQDCSRRMTILDERFQSLFGARNEYRKEYIRLTCQVVAIALVVTMLRICDNPWILLSKLSLLKNLAITVTLHYPTVIMLVLDLNFCTFVRYLGKKFRDLNDGLLELAEKSSASHPGKKIFVIPRRALKVTPENRVGDTKAESLINDKQHLLHEIRKAHLELCKLSGQINLVFGIQNLLSMGISFSTITGLSYTIYSTIIWKNFMVEKIPEIVAAVHRVIIYVFKIWAVNHSSWSVSSEAERTGEIIYELLETRVNTELQKEIKDFGVQILQNPVRFNACGFFTLDYTFVQGVIGSITTYLVILIQMS